MVEIRFFCDEIDTRSLIGPCSHVTSRCCQICDFSTFKSKVKHYQISSEFSNGFKWFQIAKTFRLGSVISLCATSDRGGKGAIPTSNYYSCITSNTTKRVVVSFKLDDIVIVHRHSSQDAQTWEFYSVNSLPPRSLLQS